MRYISKPTAKLPNGKLIVEEAFVESLVDAVNQLNDHVRAVEERLNGHDEAVSALNASVEKSGVAIQRMADAIGILIGD